MTADTSAPPFAVSEAVARFLLAPHAHPLAQDPGRLWLRRPDQAACPACPALAETLGLEGAGPDRPRKGRRAQRYRPTAKLARSRLAGELVRGMLPTLPRNFWATGGAGVTVRFDARPPSSW